MHTNINIQAQNIKSKKDSIYININSMNNIGNSSSIT